MDSIRTSKWTAFLLSACVPGAGQLAAGSWTCLLWFVAAGLLSAGWIAMQQLHSPAIWLLTLQVGCGLSLCLLSAEHAKRLLETASKPDSKAIAAPTCHPRSCGRRIDIEIVLNLARTPPELWRLIGDLPRFLVIDPFHERVTLMRDRPGEGVDLLLSHNAFGWRFPRFGRILIWREGRGYAFSDLSSRGPRAGFPHMFVVQLSPIQGEETGSPLTRLSICVRGRWTSRLVPAWLGRAWVWLVCREHARLLRKAL